MTKKWAEVNDLSNDQYSDRRSKRLITSMLRSDLCNYSDTYIVVKRRVNVTGNENANRKNKY